MQDKSGIAERLGLSPDDVIFYDAVAFTVVPTTVKFAKFKLGILALSKDSLYLASYTGSSLTLDAKLPLNSIQFSGIATRGAFKHLQQLRLEVSGSAVAVNFSNSSDAEAGYKERTQRGVVALEQLGVTVLPKVVWVLPNIAEDWHLTVPLLL